LISDAIGFDLIGVTWPAQVQFGMRHARTKEPPYRLISDRFLDYGERIERGRLRLAGQRRVDSFESIGRFFVAIRCDDTSHNSKRG
jgi:hypothetical protein